MCARYYVCIPWLSSGPAHVFDTTHMPMPVQTNAIPNHVSLVMILPSTYQSPRTVKRKASEFVIGTVSESSGETYKQVSGVIHSRQAGPKSRKRMAYVCNVCTSLYGLPNPLCSYS